jgi:hypothetical protein
MSKTRAFNPGTANEGGAGIPRPSPETTMYRTIQSANSSFSPTQYNGPSPAKAPLVGGGGGKNSATTTVSFKGKIYKRAHAHLIPELTPGEYDALRADIRDHGVVVPVFVDTENNVIDGFHRLRIAAELNGSEISFRVFKNLNANEKRQLAVSLNVLGRDLSQWQRRKMIRLLHTTSNDSN